MTSSALQLVGTLTLPFERIETIYAGASEVRKYRNKLTGNFEVGKRFDTLGVETAIAVIEGSVLQGIQHDNLVPVWAVTEVVEGPGTPEMRPIVELTMPFYPDGSVCDSFARSRRFSVHEAREIAVASLRGIAELHDVQGIFHRDIKSPNIFLDSATTARIGDLGAASYMSDDGTADGINAPQLWTPPENYHVGRVDRRSDVYSMGIVLHELLHGPLPYHEYERSDMLERLTRGRRAVRDKHLRIAPHIPRALRRAIRKGTRPDMDGRYDSALQMIHDLRRSPIVDWQPAVECEGTITWQGQAMVKNGREHRVLAEWMPRKKVWRVRSQIRSASWRRVGPDRDMPTLDGAQLRTVFDDITDKLVR